MDIKELAKKTGMLPVEERSDGMIIEWWSVTLKALEDFAEQVAQQAIAEALISVSFEVAREREACAEVADESNWPGRGHIADAIRKRPNV